MNRTQFANLTTAELVTQYADAAIRHWNAGKLLDKDGRPDVRTRNTIADELIAIHRELKTRSAVIELMALLRHDHLGVRMSAAAQCLPLAPDEILPLFEDWENSPDQQTRLKAFSTLSHWRLSQKGSTTG